MIYCEGITDDSNLSQKYKDKVSFLTQLNVFCCGSYESCELHEAIMKAKYQED